jgi:hypothetical protein
MKKSGVLCWLVLVLSWATLSGCGRFYATSKDKGQIGVTSAGDKVGTPTGRSIVAGCVVTSYAADGSTYLSEQRHIIRPDLGIIEISALEPYGTFRWKLSGSDFVVVTGAGRLDDLPMVLCDRNIAKLILTSISAAFGISAQLHASPELTKAQGRYYSVIHIGPGATYPKALKTIEVPWANLTLYGDSNSGMVEMVTIQDVHAGLMLTAHSYNFLWFKEIGKSIPMKIDVFKTDETTTWRQRILQVNYHSVKTL